MKQYWHLGNWRKQRIRHLLIATCTRLGAMEKLFIIAVLFVATLSKAAGPMGDEFAQLSEWFKRTGPKRGEAAPDFKLERARGGTVQASELWALKPLMVTTGSYTCPQFRSATTARRELVQEFQSELNSVVVYTTEAHPVGTPSPYFNREMVTEENKKEGILLPQPQTYEERLAGARHCRETLKIISFVAVDKMDNAVWKAYGSSPNCAYLIDTHGQIVFRQGLFEAAGMRAAIQKLLAVEKALRLPR